MALLLNTTLTVKSLSSKFQKYFILVCHMLQQLVFVALKSPTCLQNFVHCQFWHAQLSRGLSSLIFSGGKQRSLELHSTLASVKWSFTKNSFKFSSTNCQYCVPDYFFNSIPYMWTAFIHAVFQTSSQIRSHGVRFGKQAGHKGSLLTASSKLLCKAATDYKLYGQFHFLAVRIHNPSPHHLNVHKMV